MSSGAVVTGMEVMRGLNKQQTSPDLSSTSAELSNLPMQGFTLSPQYGHDYLWGLASHLVPGRLLSSIMEGA